MLRLNKSSEAKQAVGATWPDNRPLVLLGAALLCAAIAVLDVLTGKELSLVVLYSLPVILVAWMAGFSWALVFCVLAWFCLIGVAQVIGHVYSRPVYFLFQTATNVCSLVLLAYFVSRIRLQQEQLRRLTQVDQLTGLANRGRFEDRLSTELARARRLGHPFSLLYFDCDNFKMINDEKGHPAGDEVLKLVARILRENMRSIDLSARVGGDEFAVILTEADEKKAQAAVGHLLPPLRAALKEVDSRLGVSAGCATFLNAPPHIEQAVDAADQLMYQAKRAGRNNESFGAFRFAQSNVVAIRDAR